MIRPALQYMTSKQTKKHMGDLKIHYLCSPDLGCTETVLEGRFEIPAPEGDGESKDETIGYQEFVVGTGLLMSGTESKP